MIVETVQTPKGRVEKFITLTLTGYEVRTILEEVRKSFHMKMFLCEMEILTSEFNGDKNTIKCGPSRTTRFKPFLEVNMCFYRLILTGICRNTRSSRRCRWAWIKGMYIVHNNNNNNNNIDNNSNLKARSF